MRKIVHKEHLWCLPQRGNTCVLVVACCLTIGLPLAARAADDNSASKNAKFHLQEASISDIHQAIKRNQITCRSVVQAYINRAAAYNGVCTQLITEDGAPIPPATGAVRAGAPLVFPTSTVPVSRVLPYFDQYVGLPLDFGRMEATASDPSVRQQYGMIFGLPDAGQLNALETINIRGELGDHQRPDVGSHHGDGPVY